MFEDLDTYNGDPVHDAGLIPTITKTRATPMFSMNLI